jgi:hypothetical protein
MITLNSERNSDELFWYMKMNLNLLVAGNKQAKYGNWCVRTPVLEAATIPTNEKFAIEILAPKVVRS